MIASPRRATAPGTLPLPGRVPFILLTVLAVMLASAASAYSPLFRLALLATPVLALGPFAGHRYPGYTAGFIVLLAVFRRPMTEMGLPLADYAHYVPVFLSLAALGRPGPHPLLLRAGLGGIAAISLVSAIGNSWHALIPIILLVTYVQPFIVLFLAISATDREKQVLVRILLAVVGLQVPFVLAQVADRGPGDYVVGALGAGNAHTLGGLALCAAILVTIHVRSQLTRFALLAVFIPMAVAADAKQMLAALILAAIPIGLVATGKGSLRLIPLVAFALLAIYVGKDYAPLFEHLGDPDRAQEYAEQKQQGFEVVFERMEPRQVLLGLGPGDGFSRVSNSTVPGYGRVPASVFEAHVSALAAEYQLFYASQRGLISSAGSVYSSWAGIFSEVGLAGLAFFLVLMLWAVLATRTGDRDADLATLLLLGWWALLGLVFTWMEEPVFSTFLMAAAGASTLRRRTPSSLQAAPNRSARSLPGPRM